MVTTYRLFARNDRSSAPSRTTFYLLVALLVLFCSALVLVGTLLLLRRNRRARLADDEDGLPSYDEKSGSRGSNHRRLTITATAYGRSTESIHVYQEKQNLLDNSFSPPPSPVPEIRITFPEEIDEEGRRHSGRVVVVRVGENGVGLEPLQEDLPPYQKNGSDKFHSLDLERIGGLKEKL
jgi:hypothetical protein